MNRSTFLPCFATEIQRQYRLGSPWSRPTWKDGGDADGVDSPRQ